jgi:hypothetical protein
MKDDLQPTVPDRLDEKLYDLEGKELDGYRVIDVLGKGGMGKVYKAVDLRLRRFVALKVIAAPLFLDLELLARFEREVHALALLNHPNVAQIYSAGRHQGVPYYVMEYIEGRSLLEVLAKGERLAGRRCLGYLIAAAQGLGAALGQGLVHRDVKPSNLMVDVSGRLKLVDFGIARRIGEDSTLTDPSSVIGTPLYMSPEQALGGPVDHRSDIYSLGATFYHLFAGVPPFRGDDASEVKRRHLTAPLEPLRRHRPQIPAAVEAIIARMMAKRPEDRYQDYPGLIEDLERAARWSPPIQAAAAGPTAPAPGETPAPPVRPVPRGAWIALGFALALVVVTLLAMGGGDGGNAPPEETAVVEDEAGAPSPAAEALQTLMGEDSSERYDEAIDLANSSKSLANMRRVTTLVEVYLAERGELPPDLQTLADEDAFPPMALLDGWGRKIVLEPLETPHYRVLSTGPDRRRGTGDDIVIEDGFVVQGAPRAPSWMPRGSGAMPRPPGGLPPE